MAVIDELVCRARGSFSLSTKVLSVHVTGNQPERRDNTIAVNNGYSD